MNISDELKIRMVRKAISSLEGWGNLAQSILSQGNPVLAKKECHRIFKLMSANSQNPKEWFGILCCELDKHIGRVNDNLNHVKVGGPNLKMKIG